MQQKNYITKFGYAKLREELSDLVTVERPVLVQTITWAAGNGDRSENGDYIYGKRRLREVDKRIRMLTNKIENAEVVDPAVHVGVEKIFFGARVTILRDDEITQVVTIVGQDEIDTERNYISWTAPIARALLHKNMGDCFEFRSPNGIHFIEIIAVEYAY